MLKYTLIFGVICLVTAESPASGIKPSNVLGGAEQHASFSFIRPGLTQTSYSFNGPSSHQAFSSSIGNPHLAQKVFPNVAQALAYRNPGLGYFSNSPISSAYASMPYAPSAVQGSAPAPQLSYQHQSPLDPASLAYLQQGQQYQHFQNPQLQSQMDNYQAQLNQLMAFRQAQLLQLQPQGQAQLQSSSQQEPEQLQLQQQQQQQQQPQNLLGVAYSAAPSVAHVKVSGNGYKFNF